MTEPQATSALGGQFEVGQLTWSFFISQDCALRTPVSQNAGKRERDPERPSSSWAEVQLTFSFPPTPAQATQTGKRLWGGDRGRAS